VQLYGLVGVNVSVKNLTTCAVNTREFEGINTLIYKQQEGKYQPVRKESRKGTNNANSLICCDIKMNDVVKGG